MGAGLSKEHGALPFAYTAATTTAPEHQLPLTPPATIINGGDEEDAQDNSNNGPVSPRSISSITASTTVQVFGPSDSTTTPTPTPTATQGFVSTSHASTSAARSSSISSASHHANAQAGITSSHSSSPSNQPASLSVFWPQGNYYNTPTSSPGSTSTDLRGNPLPHTSPPSAAPPSPTTQRGDTLDQPPPLVPLPSAQVDTSTSTTVIPQNSSSLSSSSFFLRHSVSMDELSSKGSTQPREAPLESSREPTKGLSLSASTSAADLASSSQLSSGGPNSPRSSTTSSKRQSLNLSKIFGKKKEMSSSLSSLNTANPSIAETAQETYQDGDAATIRVIPSSPILSSRTPSFSPSLRLISRSRSQSHLGASSNHGNMEAEPQSAQPAKEEKRPSLFSRNRRSKAFSQSLPASHHHYAHQVENDPVGADPEYHLDGFSPYQFLQNREQPQTWDEQYYQDLSMEDLDVEGLVEDGVPVDAVLMGRKELRPICFGQLTSLATIGLCSQELSFMSPNMGLLFMTTTLELCCNQLTVIPAEIGYMKSLKILSVAKNRLTYLPDTIGHLTKLVELRASDNLITSIPHSIGELTKLTSLYLERNQITTLPSELGGNRSLVTLDLSENPVRTIPAEVGRLKFLRRLRVENCVELLMEFDHDQVWSPPTLRELSARVIVRHQVPILKCTQDDIKRYLASAHACSFCNGPYFESFVTRGKMVEKNEIRVPFEYRLCVPHWNTEKERMMVLFCPLPDTAPSPSPSPAPSAPPSGQNSPRPSPPGSPSTQRNAGGRSTPGGRRRRTSFSHVSPPPLNVSTAMTVPLSVLSKAPTLPALPVAAAGGGGGTGSTSTPSSAPTSPRSSLRTKIFVRGRMGGGLGLKQSQSMTFLHS